MPIYFGTAAPKKVYFGTAEVKKIYFGTALVWAASETVNLNVGSYYTKFGGNHYQVDIYVTATEKKYAENKMVIKVEIGIRSLGNYTISSSMTKTGSITVDGQTKSFTYNCSLSKGQYKILNTSSYTISSASAKTIKISASLPFEVSIDGVGWVSTISPSHSVKLPTL